MWLIFFSLHIKLLIKSLVKLNDEFINQDNQIVNISLDLFTLIDFIFNRNSCVVIEI